MRTPDCCPEALTAGQLAFPEVFSNVLHSKKNVSRQRGGVFRALDTTYLAYKPQDGFLSKESRFLFASEYGL